MADLTAASGATMIEWLGQPKGESMNYACGDNAGIEKGTLLWFEDPNTVSGATVAGTGKPSAGVAATEKVSGDGSTTIGCWTRGVADCTATGVVTAGQIVGISGQNLVYAISRSAESGARILEGMAFGKARETAADGEVIAIELGRL